MSPRSRRSALAIAFVAAALAALTVACSAVGIGPTDPTAGPPGGPAVTTPAQAAAVVAAQEARFAGIGPRDPNLIGQSRFWEAQPASGVGAFVVTFTIGEGDCPAGCIDWQTWTYAVSPDGSIRLISQSIT